MVKVRCLGWLLGFCLTYPLTAAADAAGTASEPATVFDEWAPLYELVTPELQQRLEATIAANPSWDKLVKSKRMAVGVVDLSGHEPHFARVNGNEMMYAASLPKIAILLAAYVSLEDGTLQNTPEIRKDMADMIRVSSNSAATRMMDRIGMERMNNILKNPKYGLYDETRGGGLWVGKRYAKEGRRLPDPMHGISHGATATQICRFYYLLATERLVGPEWTQQMMADLSDPRINHKFVHAIRERAPEATLYRKSGTWRTWHSDSIWVKGKGWRNYILTAMVESTDGERIIRNLLPAIEPLLQEPLADSRTLRQIRAGNISIITPPRPANTQTLIDG